MPRHEQEGGQHSTHERLVDEIMSQMEREGPRHAEMSGVHAGHQTDGFVDYVKEKWSELRHRGEDAPDAKSLKDLDERKNKEHEMKAATARGGHDMGGLSPGHHTDGFIDDVKHFFGVAGKDGEKGGQHAEGTRRAEQRPDAARGQEMRDRYDSSNDNHSNQLNPNNYEYGHSRGMTKPTT